MIIKSDTLCKHCGSCTAVCPNKSILIQLEKAELALYIDNRTCINCGKCVKICPVRALALKGRKNT